MCDRNEGGGEGSVVGVEWSGYSDCNDAASCVFDEQGGDGGAREFKNAKIFQCCSNERKQFPSERLLAQEVRKALNEACISNWH